MFLLPPESSTLGKSDFLIFPNKIRTKWHLFLVLILIPVVTNEVKYFLIRLFIVWVP